MLLSIFLYVFSPRYYSFSHSIVYFVVYLISLVLYFSQKKKGNYFDFDTLFLVANLFVHFIYPVFLYPIDPHFFVMFSFEFDQNLITRGTALSLCGLQAYIIGGLSIKNNRRIFENKFYSEPDIPYFPKNHLIPILIVTFLLFILNIDSSYYDGYTGGFSGLSAYILLLFVVLLSVLLYTVFINRRFVGLLYGNNKIIFIIAAVFIFFSLYVGTRTYTLMLGVLIIGLFSTYIKPISLRLFLILVGTGCLLMTIVGMTRSGGEVSLKSAADLIMDLVINCRSTYVAIEYTNEHGFTYGTSLLSNILACFPFAQGLFVSLTGIHPRDISSSGFLTSLTLGYDSSLGLGTNIIADLYLAFGLIGVIVLMYVLGRLIAKLMNKLYVSEYSSIIYFVILSQCLYMTRGEFFTPLRYVVWSLIIVYFTRKYRKYKCTAYRFTENI